MAYDCKQCVGKLKKDFAKKYNGEYLCRLENSVVYCNPKEDVVEEGKFGVSGFTGIPMIGLASITYKCKTIDKRYAVPACSFGGHPHWGELAAMEMVNDYLRTGQLDKVTGTYDKKFLAILKDLLENDGFEPIKE